MIAAIMVALALLANGDCPPAEHYPTHAAAMATITGYVQIDACVLPTTADLAAGKQCRIMAILSNTSDVVCFGDGIEIGP